jgi:endonuclease/exonuclease/phosphatase family metal-dependent hydrolase
VAKTIFWLQDEYGRLPDLIGLAEMENRNVLYRLLKDTALKKTDYKFIHYDGRDRRGIDVAILYRSSLMKPVSHTRKVPVLESEDPAREDADTLDTRDILHVRMELKNGLTGHSDVDFIVNHHPSKYGGARQSDRRREAAMTCLRQLCDSLVSDSSARSLIAMGDFNDTPDSAPFRLLDGRLVNMGLPLHAKGLGTIRYEGKWDLIDMFLTDPETAERSCMEIVRVPFLMVKDSKHPGEKPLRTYSGPKYLGGVSDHCPVILMVNLQNY